MRKFLLSVASVVLISFSGALAQDPEIDPDLVVAEVNGEPIYFSSIELLYNAFANQLQGLPLSFVYEELLNFAVQTETLAQRGEANGLADTRAFQERLAFLRSNVLEQEYLDTELNARLTDARVEEAYTAYIADFVAEEEVSARHILVETEEEALALIMRLDAGEDFSVLAAEESLDPGSAAQGGELGFFGRGMMVPPFEEAAFDQEVGQYSLAPVESQFGFHILLVDERRTTQPASLEEERARIEGELATLILEEIRAEASEEADIIISPNPFLPPEEEAEEVQVEDGSDADMSADAEEEMSEEETTEAANES